MARKLTRNQLIPFFAELPPCVVAMEACASAHHWGRALIELGHEVRLLPPAHVKPYVRRNKSDQVEAAAIYEAMSRPGQRFVPVRSIENQAALMRHRVRGHCHTRQEKAVFGGICSDLEAFNSLIFLLAIFECSGG